MSLSGYRLLSICCQPGLAECLSGRAGCLPQHVVTDVGVSGRLTHRTVPKCLGDDMQAAVGVGKLACEGVPQIMDADILNGFSEDGFRVGQDAPPCLVDVDDRLVGVTGIREQPRRIPATGQAGDQGQCLIVEQYDATVTVLGVAQRQLGTPMCSNRPPRMTWLSARWASAPALRPPPRKSARPGA